MTMEKDIFINHLNWFISTLKDGRITTEQEIEHQCHWLFLIGFLFASNEHSQTSMIETLNRLEGNPNQISDYYNSLIGVNKDDE